MEEPKEEALHRNQGSLASAERFGKEVSGVQDAADCCSACSRPPAAGPRARGWEQGGQGLGWGGGGVSQALRSELQYHLRCFYLGGSARMTGVLTMSLRKVKWPPDG